MLEGLYIFIGHNLYISIILSIIITITVYSIEYIIHMYHAFM
jgi:hypothetical protein